MERCDCPITWVGRLLKPMCPVGKSLFRKIFGVKIYGEENVPKGCGYIVASNHRSNLDPIVLNSVFPEPLFFLAKEELFKFPLGILLRHLRGVPIRRGKGDVFALERALEILKRDCPLCIFPEGTRAERGKFLKPKAGVGLLALKSKKPVVPVLIEGTDRILPKGAKLLRPPFKVEVFIGKPKVYEGKESLRGYKEVANSIMEAIKSLKS